MSTSHTSAGGGLRFTVFDIPVTISLSIVLVLAFLGFQLRDPVEIVLWVAIGLLAIVLHELGHAFAARAAGAVPEIELAGLGGLTRYRGTARTAGRGWSLLISLAGPATGIVLGLLAITAGAPCCSVSPGAAPAEFSLSVFVYVSLVWSVLNLLPILPLDGGQALASLLPGSAAQRRRRVAWIGSVVGAAATLAAFAAGFTYGAFLVGFLTWHNVSVILAARRSDQVTGLAEDGDLRAARDALAAGRGDPRTAAELQQRAFGAGSFQIAAEVGEIALQRGFAHPWYAYNSACAWAQLGMLDRAVATLDRALELGFDDRERLRSDPDLAPLHDHPAWRRLTGR